jgi:hypothetical protein
LSQTFFFTKPNTDAFQRSITFQVANFNSNLNQNSDGDIAPPNQLAPIQPQWHVSTPIANQGFLYDVAWISNVSNANGENPNGLAQFAFDDPPVSGAWKQINEFPGSQTANFRFFPTVATTYFTEDIYQIRLHLAPFTILAEATIILQCIVS